MKYAYYIRTLEDWQSDAALYELSEPLNGHTHVIVSKLHNKYAFERYAHETYAFPATADGKVIEYLELDCSRVGEYSHEDILAIAGYVVVPLSAVPEIHSLK